MSESHDRFDRPRAAPRALLLDLDGTLVDSLPDIAYAANATLEELGRPTVELERVRAFIGKGARWLMHCGLAGEDALLDLAEAAFVRHYDAHPADRSTLFPGWSSFLEQCAERGIALAIVSNKPVRLCDAVLGALGVAEHFALVIGDGSYPELKPSPAPFCGALERLGVAADEALVVGDGVPDVVGARRAGIAVAAATWGYTDPEELVALEPDWVVRDVGALAALVFAEDRVVFGSRPDRPAPET